MKQNEVDCSLADHSFYSANGNGNSYRWDINTGQIVSTFEGHQDYLHCVKYHHESRKLYTGSEDGNVRVWDTRTTECVHILDPWRGEEVKNTEECHGKWVSSIALDDFGNWMICSTGDRLITLWSTHYPTITSAMITPTEPNHVIFYRNKVKSVGNDKYIHTWNLNGQFESRLESSSKALFSIATSDQSILAVSGVSPNIDIFTDYLSTQAATLRLSLSDENTF